MMFRWIKHFFASTNGKSAERSNRLLAFAESSFIGSAENVEKLSRIFTGSSMEVGISDGH